MFSHKSAILVTLFLYFIFVHGVCSIHVSEEGHIDFDREFQQLQKPSVKTIQDEFGTTYDCVDFYKQPAFGHPLLQNHTFHPEMKPSFTPTGGTLPCKRFDSMKLNNGGGCPIGTVPIRRIDKNDFNGIKRFTQEYAKYNLRDPMPGTHLAILQTNSNPRTTKYYGAGGYFNVYNLSIGPSQYSSGEIIIQNGDDRIKVGWTVNPTLNKDSRIRLFQYIDAGRSHCFNALCPGFVHTMKELPINVPMHSASKRGGQQFYVALRVFQDVKTGHWWLDVCGYNLGFWPKEIFSSLSTSATYIAVGGEVYSPPGTPLPPMGNGYYPVDNKLLSAYCTHFEVLDENQRWINPQKTETYSDDSHYGIYDEGILGADGRVIYYGGTTLWI